MSTVMQSHRGEREEPPHGGTCRTCGAPLHPSERPGPPKLYCSGKCKSKAGWLRRKAATVGSAKSRPTVGRKRRPLPEAASEAAWKLRKDTERIERIVADDRYPQNEGQVAPLLRSHLSHTAKACQDLLSRIDHSQGE